MDKTKDIKDKIDKLKNIFVTEIKIKVHTKTLKIKIYKKKTN